MTGWRFLLSKRWFGYFALCTVFAIVTILLGNWQFDRRVTVLAENELIISNYDADPVPIKVALPELSEFAASHTWQQVELTGSYLVEQQLLARARPMNAQPGFEILTPFLTDDGTVFVVNRGWIPTGYKQDIPDHIPESPTGKITVVARLRPGEPDLPGREAPAGQISSIQLDEIIEFVGQPGYTGSYGSLVSEMPSSETGILTPRPQLTEGPHLGYALQWYVFAAMGFIGLGYFALAEHRKLNPEASSTKKWRQAQLNKKQRARQSDEEYEDQLLG